MECFRKFLSFFLIFALMIKSLAATIATAGILDTISPALPQNPGLTDHAQQVATRAVVSKTMAVAIEGTRPQDVLKTAPLDVAIDTVGGYAFQNIGDHQGTLGELGHTVAHFGAGFATGFALSKGNLHGGLSGGLGAVLAEKTAEWLPATNTPETNAELGKLVAVTATALIPGLNPDIAHHTGTTAVEHNYMGHLTTATLTEQEEAEESARVLWELANQEIPGTPLTPLDLVPYGGLAIKGAKVAAKIVATAVKALPKATLTTAPKIVPKKPPPASLPKPKPLPATPKPKTVSNPSQGPPKTDVAAFEAKHGKKAVQNMSTQEVAQKLANSADRKIPGTGPLVGQKKHTYAEDLLKKYQEKTGNLTDLKMEKRYKNNEPWEKGMGPKNSVIPDLYSKEEGLVLDYKFGGAKLKPEQVNRYQQTMPLHKGNPIDMIEIKPQIPPPPPQP